MGVKVRKRNGKWYVVIDYHGRRKSKCVGSREAAEHAKREIEARLVLGEVGILREPDKAETFRVTRCAAPKTVNSGKLPFSSRLTPYS